ncbi:MAG: hypothetical protein WBD86_02700 [Microgenomates group bacterium]
MKIKKFLPLILLLLGLAVVAGAYFFVIKGKKDDTVVDDESSLIEVSLTDRPIASLTPSDDGHWLKLAIEKLKIDAESLDYELLYKVSDGRTQGVPGTISLAGQTMIERDLLLGSESSGKFRYDEGVEEGTLTLRFRNKKGKLIAKFSTQFSLLSGTSKLASTDDNFSVTLTRVSNAFFVVMETFGVPGDPPGDLAAGPYGVFSSSEAELAGIASISSGTLYGWTGKKWVGLSGGDTSAPGIFIGTSE